MTKSEHETADHKQAERKKDWSMVAEEATPSAESPLEEGKETQHDAEIDSLSPEALKVELTKARAKAEENWHLVLRARAELENLERRHRTEREKERLYAIEKFATELLLVVDSLEHGLVACVEGEQAVEALRQGMELTLKVLLKVFEKFSIKSIDPTGEIFDPSHHEAMGTQENTEVAPGTVLTVMQKGYQLHGRVLRPARVVIAKPSEQQ